MGRVRNAEQLSLAESVISDLGPGEYDEDSPEAWAILVGSSCQGRPCRSSNRPPHSPVDLTSWLYWLSPESRSGSLSNSVEPGQQALAVRIPAAALGRGCTPKLSQPQKKSSRRFVEPGFRRIGIDRARWDPP